MFRSVPRAFVRYNNYRTFSAIGVQRKDANIFDKVKDAASAVKDKVVDTANNVKETLSEASHNPQDDLKNPALKDKLVGNFISQHGTDNLHDSVKNAKQNPSANKSGPQGNMFQNQYKDSAVQKEEAGIPNFRDTRRDKDPELTVEVDLRDGEDRAYREGTLDRSKRPKPPTPLIRPQELHPEQDIAIADKYYAENPDSSVLDGIKNAPIFDKLKESADAVKEKVTDTANSVKDSITGNSDDAKSQDKNTKKPDDKSNQNVDLNSATSTAKSAV
ncbi:lipoyl synthase, mitochondrial [Acrasis kona]|uniref:Lipoyl synthase, mitochondrial n=1 Tax=Acrasis kona TaxID=1008807 RepID=A0AAW2YL90_9EUKA